MAAIRTVMITMPPMLRDLITELMVGHGIFNVVAKLDTRDRLEHHLQGLAPDLILIGLLRNEGDEIGLVLLRLLPAVKVIAFSSDARVAFVQRMQPQRTVLHEVSPKMLINAIIGA